VASWHEIVADRPEFASQVEARFDAYKHKVIATLRKDGSPRISGIEAEFRDGEVRVGMMPGSLKSKDVARDPRVAIHSATEDPVEGEGMAGRVVDAKIAGRAVPISPQDGKTGGGPPGTFFRVDISEVVLVSIGEPADHLVIESWDVKNRYRRRTRS
jgi:hypothetical protein